MIVDSSWKVFKNIKKQQLKQGPFRLSEINGKLQPSINDAISSSYVLPGYFSKIQCKKIIQTVDSSGFKTGIAVDDNKNVRRSEVTWLEPEKDNAWIFDHIEKATMLANKYFKFDLTGFFQGIQIAKYEKDGKYDWHSDLGDGTMSSRKLSISVLLNDPNDYTGGRLEFKGNTKNEIAKPQGTAIIFPSYLIHRVAPIESGIRYSLVSWISGPPFR